MAAADLLAAAGADARTRGLLFHEWFQKVGFSDQPDGVPHESALRACARREAPEVPDGELSTWIAEFREALRVPEIREVLEQNGAKELWTERAFALRVDGQLLQGRAGAAQRGQQGLQVVACGWGLEAMPGCFHVWNLPELGSSCHLGPAARA